MDDVRSRMKKLDIEGDLPPDVDARMRARMLSEYRRARTDGADDPEVRGETAATADGDDAAIIELDWMPHPVGHQHDEHARRQLLTRVATVAAVAVVGALAWALISRSEPATTLTETEATELIDAVCNAELSTAADALDLIRLGATEATADAFLESSSAALARLLAADIDPALREELSSIAEELDALERTAGADQLVPSAGRMAAVLSDAFPASSCNWSRFEPTRDSDDSFYDGFEG